jgi:integrase
LKKSSELGLGVGSAFYLSNWSYRFKTDFWLVWDKYVPRIENGIKQVYTWWYLKAWCRCKAGIALEHLHPHNSRHSFPSNLAAG